MTETSRSFYTPTRQATEDRSVIDHLIKTFHDKPAPAQKPSQTDAVSARICRQWTPENRAMLEILYAS